MANGDSSKRTWTSYFTKKVIVILSAVATVFTIVAGIWAFEAHYATNKRVDKVEKESIASIFKLEEAVAGALINQQHKSDVRFFQLELERVQRDIYDLRREIEKNPQDHTLQRDYEELLRRKEIIKEKLDEALESIKVQN